MQLKQELHNLQKNKMNINDYSIKVKNLIDVLASIRAPVDDENLVAVCEVTFRHSTLGFTR